MVCKVPYETFLDATLLHPDMGIRMKHRAKELGRPKLDDNKWRIVQICNAWLATSFGSDKVANEACDLCEKRRTTFEQVAEVLSMLDVLS